MQHFNIAVDGPSGAGKSTLARRLALRLKCMYVDTGALYRTIALYMLRQNVQTEQDITAALSGLTVTMKHKDGEQHVFSNGEDVTSLIRTSEVSMAASRVSAIPAVRAFLLQLQRSLAETHSVVMDGRDIGTVVLPDADVKIYLTASAEKRAYRRFLELEEKQPGAQTFESVLNDVIRRDEQDMNRTISPLKQAEDAVLVDTSDADLAQSEEMLLTVVKEKLGL